MADKLEIHWDQKGLSKAIGESPEVESEITKMTNERVSKANSIGASFKTGYFYDREEGRRKGGTTAVYKGDVKKSSGADRWPIGMVTTDNYAANQDNLKNNTLLKVI